MKNYFMVSECSGDLFDTRKEGWHKRPPIRPNYGKIERDVRTDNTALKAAIRTKYAWPGGYELFGVCNDGEAMCCDCMQREYYLIAYSRRHQIDDGWRIVAVDCAAEYDDLVQCVHCNKIIVEDWQEEEEAEND